MRLNSFSKSDVFYGHPQVPATTLSKLSCVKGKGKAIPLQAWTVPEGSRRLRLTDFKTFDT
jgi:hypothetical protein